MTTAVRDMYFVGDVLTMLKISRTTLFRMERDKQFPPGHIVRGRKVWFAPQIVAWQDTLPAWDYEKRKRA
jgi:predicted DNA-binding transcriptional regulator AlpA